MLDAGCGIFNAHLTNELSTLHTKLNHRLDIRVFCARGFGMASFTRFSHKWFAFTDIRTKREEDLTMHFLPHVHPGLTFYY